MELYYVWLECIKGFGPVAWHDFLWEYGDPEMIYRNRHELLPKGRISGSQIEILKERADDAFENAAVILKKCQHYGIRILTYNDPEYAENIKKYKDFPIVFYTKGHLRDNWTHGCGIVGARRCSLEGKKYAIDVASQEVARGRGLISGMAKGIDSYAHTAALKQSGYTVAVLAYGIDQCYPVEHKALMGKIENEGLLLSEYPPETVPYRHSFPRRNRIIAGLSDVLYVIDAGKNSGTKTTVEAAERYGKQIVKANFYKDV